MNYNNSVSTKEKHEEGASYSAMINDPLIDLSLDEINQNIFLLSNYFFPNCSISYYCLNPETKKIEHTLANIDLWPIQENTIRWLSHHVKKRKKSAPYIYVKNRSLFILTDFSRLKLDKEKFNYSCDDCLFINLTKSDGSLYGILFIHRWFDKKKLDFTQSSLSEKMTLFTQKLNRLSILVDNFFIKNKIDSLLLSKKSLKFRINADELSLKNKLLELETMFETSTELGHSLNYHEIIKKTSLSVKKVIDYNFLSVFLSDSFYSNELFITQSHHFNKEIVDEVINDTINFSKLFFTSPMGNEHDISIIHSKISYKVFNSSNSTICSHISLPLVFQGNNIGTVILFGQVDQELDNSELQFINTITNNLASSLGKIKIIRDLEKSKLYSVIEGIQEPIIILDEKHHVNLLNLEARNMVNASTKSISKHELFELINTIGLLSLFNRVKATKKAIINQETTYFNKNYIVNISPILNDSQGYVGVIFLFRDVTQIQQMNRITTQRLTAMSQVNNIINSIQKPNELLNLLMDFLLQTTNCNMGSIQIKKQNTYITAIHSSFPEKIRKTYRFNNKRSISDIVAETKKPLLIDNYFSHDDLDKNVKVIIELYVCIPVMINNEIIGIINLLRKYGTTTSPFTPEDFDTLLKIASIVATALHNSLLYNEKIEKEKIDQELKLATKIHKNLLQEDLPQHKKMSFGVVNIPARKLGGDFYDIIKFNDNKIAVIIADIVGKGIPAGLYMAVLKSIVNRYISQYKRPSVLLAKLSKVVFNDPVINSFIPFFLGIFDFKNNLFTYSNAGHEPAFIIREKKFIKCGATDIPIGSFKSQTFSESTVPLQHGDSFLGFTDGMVELFRENHKHHFENIKRFYLKNRSFPPSTICSKFEAHINSMSKDIEKRDDITAIVCKYLKTKQSVPKLLIYKEITTSSSLKEIKTVRNIIKDICTQAKYNQKTIFDCQLSVNEVQANIIEHSYLGDEEKTISFKFQAFVDRLIIQIKDFGIKHQNNYILDSSMNIDNSEGSGLGVFLIYSLMDEVKYEPSTMFNKLSLVKYDLK